MRQYRKDISEKGQHSPEYLNQYVQEVIKILPDSIKKIGDIGCGTGFHSNILKQKYLDKTFIGIDFSKATIDYLTNSDTKIFEELYWCSSKKLPIHDKYVDVVLCMENLEHLYHEDVMDALYELKRVSKYIIITTPIPERVINLQWLSKELFEAINDNIALNEQDYISLESCVHKSVIYPKSFLEAGFKQIKNYGSESECYYAESDNVDLSKIKFTAIHNSNLLTNCDYKDKYIDLLKQSISMNNEIFSLL